MEMLDITATLHTHTHTLSHVYLDQTVRGGLCGFISSNLFCACTVAQWVALLSHSKKVLTELGDLCGF